MMAHRSHAIASATLLALWLAAACARAGAAPYDLVVAGMVMIGLIGLVLDLLVRRLEKFDEVRWGYGQR